MAMRSRTTFKKRQKELARQEKQRDKAARRLQRKLEKGSGESGDTASVFADDDDLEDIEPSAGGGTHSPGETQ